MGIIDHVKKISRIPSEYYMGGMSYIAIHFFQKPGALEEEQARISTRGLSSRIGLGKCVAEVMVFQP